MLAQRNRISRMQEQREGDHSCVIAVGLSLKYCHRLSPMINCVCTLRESPFGSKVADIAFLVIVAIVRNKS